MPDGRGPIDWEALRCTERTVRNRLGDLLLEASYVPSAIDPVELRLTVGAGFDADRARFDVQWWEHHGYKYHYRELHDPSDSPRRPESRGDERDPSNRPRRASDPIEFRFGWESRPSSPYPAKHFHPPGRMNEHHESCISHEEPTLVTLAVLACWWNALEADDPSVLNRQRDPP